MSDWVKAVRWWDQKRFKIILNAARSVQITADIFLLAKSTSLNKLLWSPEMTDVTFLPKEEPVVSDSQIQNLCGLQAGMHCTILWKMGITESNSSHCRWLSSRFRLQQVLCTCLVEVKCLLYFWIDLSGNAHGSMTAVWFKWMHLSETIHGFKIKIILTIGNYKINNLLLFHNVPQAMDSLQLQPCGPPTVALVSLA